MRGGLRTLRKEEDEDEGLNALQYSILFNSQSSEAKDIIICHSLHR